jgi:hypothetical protein
MQVELLNRRRWRTRVELANEIFDYIEVFHNRRRRHSSLEMLTPIEYEKMTPPIGSGMRSSEPTPRNPGNITLIHRRMWSMGHRSSTCW